MVVTLNVLEHRTMFIKANDYLNNKYHPDSNESIKECWLKEFKAHLIPDKYVPDKIGEVAFTSEEDASWFMLQWS